MRVEKYLSAMIAMEKARIADPYLPIIQSITDLDFYKITMQQVSFYGERIQDDNIVAFRQIPVRYEWQNRDKTCRIIDIVPENILRSQLKQAQNLKFTTEEIAYLASLDLFKPEFLVYLANDFSLSDFVLYKTEGDYKLYIEGTWPEAILWETIVMSIMSELIARFEMEQNGLTVEKVWLEGFKRLQEKVRILKANPEVRFADFGTRRRYSHLWQRFVLLYLKQEIPEQLLGTSNVFFARELGLKPIGTMAHEYIMVFSAIFRDKFTQSQNIAFDYWQQMYGDKLLIALTDTYGSDFFFRTSSQEMAQKWDGQRQDSGDPFEYGYKMIDYYAAHSVDSRSKTVIFSDGLDVNKMVDLYNEFADLLTVLFGIGTNLTNDMHDKLTAPKIVVKAIEALALWLVKLSDTPGKFSGTREGIYHTICEMEYGKVLA